MTFAVYERDLAGERLCCGIQDEKGRIFSCSHYERCQLEELVEILNRWDVSEVHVEEVIQDFDWSYKHMGRWQ